MTSWFIDRARLANRPGFADTETVLLPIVLLFFAILAAAGMAYGTHPGWAQFHNGFDFILIARQLQWPMAALSLILCLGLLALVISGKRRAWWLIGLGPVLALFVHRFATDPTNRFATIENPTFVTAADANFIGEADWVVGLRFGENHYAYPYAALFDTPVVVHAEHDQRLAVLWSAYANRALAVRVERGLRAANLDVVSMPANALLLYNTRIGQFINALTGRTPEGERPDGFREEVAVTKTTWRQWRARHADTKVLAPTAKTYAAAPRGPLVPAYPLPPGASDAPAGVRVAVVWAQPPIALRTEQVTAAPLNVGNANGPLLAFRDADGSVRAFERRVDDLRPKFRPNADPKRKNAAFVDADIGAGWNTTGVAVDGPAEFRGKRLKPVLVEDGLDFRLMKVWYPELQIVAPGA